MALPTIIEAAEEYLFEDRDRMEAAGLPVATIDHILRIRDVYNFWITFPSKRDRDIVNELMRRGAIGQTRAYEDLKIIKVLLGNFHKTTKDYHRYRFLEMVRKAYDKAEARGDTRAMVAAADKYGKYMQLDKEDQRDFDYDQIVPLELKPTDDPSVIGIQPVPNIREKIRKKKEQYWNENVQDVDFEPIEFNIDDVFHPKKDEKGK